MTVLLTLYVLIWPVIVLAVDRRHDHRSQPAYGRAERVKNFSEASHKPVQAQIGGGPVESEPASGIAYGQKGISYGRRSIVV